MKVLLRRLYNSWRYYTLSPNKYRECMELSFTGNNLIGLMQANTVVAVLCICFSILPVVIERNISKGVIYFSASFVSLLIVIAARYLYSRHKKNKNVNRLYISGLIVLYYINIMFFGLYIGILAPIGPPVAMAFLCFLIVALFLFITSPMFNLLLTLSAMGAFIICSIVSTISRGLEYDFATVLLAAILALFVGWQINKYRMLAVSSKRETEAIIQNLPGVVFQHNYKPLEYTFTFISGGCRELTGYTADELLGKDVVSILKIAQIGEDGPTRKSREETLLKSLTSETTFQITTKNGETKWLWERSHVIEKNPDGSPSLIEGYCTDITVQKQIETAQMANLMLDTFPLCSLLWDRNANVMYCNEAAVKLFGFENKQELMERFLKECLVGFQPDGQSSAEKGAMVLNKAFEEGRCFFDWMYQMPDGTPLPVEITFVRMSYKDDYLVVGYTRDMREIKRLEAEAKKIYYDALTGIYNRRFFDDNLKRLFKTLIRSGGALGLLMIDIDFFKNYNDKYGHSEGDKCLKFVAEALSKIVTRTDDFVVRYGGEEFAVVLPNTDEFGACSVAEKMLQSIRDLNIVHEKSDAAPCITISIGVISGKPEYMHNIEDYIKRADEMLYMSKRTGRNRYTFSYIE